MKNRVSPRVPWRGTDRWREMWLPWALTLLSQKGTQSWPFFPLLSKVTGCLHSRQWYKEHHVSMSPVSMPTAPASPPLGSHHCTVPDRPWAGSHTGAGAALAASSEPGWDAVRGVWEVAFLFSCQCSLEKPALQSLPLMCSRQEAAFVIRRQSECSLALSIDFRDGGQSLRRCGTWLHSLTEHTGSVGWEGTLGALVSTRLQR